jgi:hypothetical protein
MQQIDNDNDNYDRRKCIVPSKEKEGKGVKKMNEQRNGKVMFIRSLHPAKPVDQVD